MVCQASPTRRRTGGQRCDVAGAGTGSCWLILGPYRSGDFELLKYIRYYTEHEAQQTSPIRFWQLLLARV